MWSWVLHRITGATIFFFLFVHVLDTALVRVSPQAYNEVIETYKTPIVGLMEFGLVAAVLFHALNGIRIILIDFWSQGPRYQRLMLWIVGVVYLLVMVPAAVVHRASTCWSTSDEQPRPSARPRPDGPGPAAQPRPPRQPGQSAVTAAARRHTNFEMYAWLFMRFSGVVLVVLVLGHLFIMLMWDNGV